MPGPGCSVAEIGDVIKYKIQMGDLVTGFVSLETGLRGYFVKWTGKAVFIEPCMMLNSPTSNHAEDCSLDILATSLKKPI